MTQEVSPIRAALNEIEGTFLLIEPVAMDDAIVGLVSGCGKEPVVCYDRAKVIEILMKDGMDAEEAEEFFSVNIEGAYMGEGTPMFIESTKNLLERH
ncbi:hypothetical protein [Burkholderia ubonensis]|uniref:hypothetical protein n=1 Tax=Burkholderia ubonensis TaxID=101571 RepID=UPI000752E7B6|nr:hypothetical protein [Burkholderia ubonensis]KVP75111.1 hypothetical protein WJ93_06760 [Burkholderia ubonensis]